MADHRRPTQTRLLPNYDNSGKRSPFLRIRFLGRGGLADSLKKICFRFSDYRLGVQTNTVQWVRKITTS